MDGYGKLWVADHAGDDYLQVLHRLHEWLRPATYLEIGCDRGESLALAQCPSVAVDPSPDLSVPGAIGTKPVCAFYRMSSDLFFDRHDPRQVLGRPVDLAFLDGMHWCEFLLRDFINTERCSRRNSVIVMHDCLPVEWPMAERTPGLPALRNHHVHAWAGDVWRTALLLKRRRPDLHITAYAAPPTGLVCVTNLSPDSTLLQDSYADCVREMMAQSLSEFGIDRLFAELAVEPTEAIGYRQAVSSRFWLEGSGA